MGDGIIVIGRGLQLEIIWLVFSTPALLMLHGFICLFGHSYNVIWSFDGSSSITLSQRCDE